MNDGPSRPTSSWGGSYGRLAGDSAVSSRAASPVRNGPVRRQGLLCRHLELTHGGAELDGKAFPGLVQEA